MGRTSGEEDSFGVYVDRVDDRIVAAEVVHERPIGARPLLDVVPA